MIDICVIGHISRDIIRIPHHEAKVTPGGVAIYGARAAHSVGARVSVLTKLKHSDQVVMCAPLTKLNIPTLARDSSTTTEFELVYKDQHLDVRDQFLRTLADPFKITDLGESQARIFHLGPLMAADMTPEFIDTVARRGRIGLDVQGFVRSALDGRIHIGDWSDKKRVLPLVDILKADLTEAHALTGEADAPRAARALTRLGAREVLITDGQKGSLIYVDGVATPIPAFKPTRFVDATGCGDTYMAAYLVHRLNSDDTHAAGLFAAAAASLKLSGHGPLVGSKAEIEKLVLQLDAE